MAQHKNQGNRTELNTLTAARKALTIDDVRFVGQLAKFMETMIAEHPAEVVEHFFSAWMRATCIEVDEGTRLLGSSTQHMLDFYATMAEGLRVRIAEAHREP